MTARVSGIESDLLRDAVRHLHAGGLLIYPTETAYAIGCDATNARAVRAIYRLKGREHGKPLPLIVASRAMAARYAQFTPLARRLAKKYWPGPLTLVLTQDISPPPPQWRGSERGRRVLAPGIIAPNGTIALRTSSHSIARALSRALGRPIVSTSANRSGEPPCYSVGSALQSFGVHQPSSFLLPLRGRSSSSRGGVGGGAWRVRGGGVLVVATGPLPRRRPSTIVDAHGDRPVILRQGAIRVR
ncbi:L-threonylcarbamoyladenylate synthase [Candidatus Uhrbacteria bacterium]|nr:L-threonylcarbamoyladenylate synthase [Candidatus Uhrbacteria bacterium]